VELGVVSKGANQQLGLLTHVNSTVGHYSNDDGPETVGNSEQPRLMTWRYWTILQKSPTQAK